MMRVFATCLLLGATVFVAGCSTYVENEASLAFEPIYPSAHVTPEGEAPTGANAAFDGVGTLHFLSGNKYQGELKGSMMSGKGAYVWAAEEVQYDGDFTRNTLDGHGEYTCQCAEGFGGDSCEEVVPAVYLCHDDERTDCDDHATCMHTGPGTHDCTCIYGFAGDGHSCAEQGTTRCLADCTLEVHCPALPELEGATITLSNGNIAPSNCP